MEILGDIEFSILFVFKIAIVVFLFVYVIFSAVVVKQVNIMTETLKVGFEAPLKTVSLLHFLASALFLIFAIIVL